MILGLLLVGSFSLFAQTKKVTTYYDYYKTQVKETYSVLISNPTIQHGYYKFYEKNTVVALEGNFINGLANGKWIGRYMSNGEIISIVYFDKDGLQTGLGQWWCEETGHKLHVEGNYSKGKEIGIHKTYYCESGNIKFIREYSDGVLIKEEDFADNGNKMWVGEYSNGVMVREEKYDENGKLIPSKSDIEIKKQEEEKQKQEELIKYKNLKRSISEDYDEVEELYVEVFDGDTIIKKKNLYKAYRIYYDDIKKAVDSISDVPTKILVSEDFTALLKRMIELYYIDTTEIEKQLENKTDLNQIEKILKIY